MPIIITIMIAMFLILISWTWHNLGDIEKIKKIEKNTCNIKEHHVK